ncbi:MAG: hypothetical protein KIH69_007330 [Anaerolineae bacterium]|nr:hypothetical protein [Anaerolineae bacterium]
MPEKEEKFERIGNYDKYEKITADPSGNGLTITGIRRIKDFTIAVSAATQAIVDTFKDVKIFQLNVYSSDDHEYKAFKDKSEKDYALYLKENEKALRESGRLIADIFLKQTQASDLNKALDYHALLESAINLATSGTSVAPTVYREITFTYENLKYLDPKKQYLFIYSLDPDLKKGEQDSYKWTNTDTSSIDATVETQGGRPSIQIKYINVVKAISSPQSGIVASARSSNPRRLDNYGTTSAGNWSLDVIAARDDLKGYRITSGNWSLP